MWSGGSRHRRAPSGRRGSSSWIHRMTTSCSTGRCACSTAKRRPASPSLRSTRSGSRPPSSRGSGSTGSAATATRWSRCSAPDGPQRQPAGELEGRRLPRQLRPVHERAPRRRRPRPGHLRQAHRRRRREPGQAAATVHGRGEGRADPRVTERTVTRRPRDVHRPDGRVRSRPRRAHPRQGVARLLRVRRRAAAGVDEPQARTGCAHGLPDVELHAHLRVLKYLEGHRELWRQGLRPRPARGGESAEGEVPIKVNELLDRMQYLIQNARHVPLSTQVMVNEDEMMELIDQISFNLPDEIKQANWTVSEQQRIISEAHAEAARTMSRANERAEEIASEHEVLRRAERHAAQVVKDAQARSDQIVRDSEKYALEQLKQLEAHLARTLSTVRRGMEALQSNQPVEEEHEAPVS